MPVIGGYAQPTKRKMVIMPEWASGAGQPALSPGLSSIPTTPYLGIQEFISDLKPSINKQSVPIDEYSGFVNGALDDVLVGQTHEITVTQFFRNAGASIWFYQAMLGAASGLAADTVSGSSSPYTHSILGAYTSNRVPTFSIWYDPGDGNAFYFRQCTIKSYRLTWAENGMVMLETIFDSIVGQASGDTNWVPMPTVANTTNASTFTITGTTSTPGGQTATTTSANSFGIIPGTQVYLTDGGSHNETVTITKVTYSGSTTTLKFTTTGAYAYTTGSILSNLVRTPVDTGVNADVCRTTDTSYNLYGSTGSLYQFLILGGEFTLTRDNTPLFGANANSLGTPGGTDPQDIQPNTIAAAGTFTMVYNGNQNVGKIYHDFRDSKLIQAYLSGSIVPAAQFQIQDYSNAGFNTTFTTSPVKYNTFDEDSGSAELRINLGYTAYTSRSGLFGVSPYSAAQQTISQASVINPYSSSYAF